MKKARKTKQAGNMTDKNLMPEQQTLPDYPVEQIDKIMILVANNISKEVMLGGIKNNDKDNDKFKLPGITVEALDGLIVAARQKLTLAAEYNRDEELGKSITRFGELYKKANGIQDYKTALAAEKGRIQLLGLQRAAQEAQQRMLEQGKKSGDEDAPRGHARVPDANAADAYDAIDDKLEPALAGLAEIPTDATYARIIELAAGVIVKLKKPAKTGKGA